jgi:gluconolactonase
MRRFAVIFCLLGCSSSSESPANTEDAAVDSAPAVVGDVETYVEVDGSSEGIAFGKDGALYVGVSGALTRIAADRTVTKVVDVPGLLGFALRADGDFVACGKGEGDAGKAAEPGVIWRVKTDGTKSVLVGPSAGASWKQPNFVVVAKDDSIVWSDSGKNEVWSAKADGSMPTKVTDAIVYPNGMAFSPDGNTLYVASWSGKKVLSLARKADGTYDAPVTAIDGVENVDGISVAANGDLYLVCSGLGVVQASGGKTKVVAPGSSFKLSANGAFGEQWLYVTNLIGSSISRVLVGVNGAPLPVR